MKVWVHESMSVWMYESVGVWVYESIMCMSTGNALG